MNNRTLFIRIILIAGLVAWLLNTELLHFDEEFFIGIFSCIFFFTLYKLMYSTITAMFFQHCDIVYVTLAFLLHIILLSLQVCKQLLVGTLLKLQANELGVLLSYNRLLRVLGLGLTRGGINEVIGVVALAAFTRSSNE